MFFPESCRLRDSDLFTAQPWYFGQKGRIRRAGIEFHGQIDYVKVCSLCSGPNGAEVALRVNARYTDAETWVKSNSCVMVFMKPSLLQCVDIFIQRRYFEDKRSKIWSSVQLLRSMLTVCQFLLDTKITSRKQSKDRKTCAESLKRKFLLKNLYLK